MVRASAWVGVHTLAGIVLVFEEIAEHAARHIDELSADGYHFLS